jgi:hypothetical protein
MEGQMQTARQALDRYDDAAQGYVDAWDDGSGLTWLTVRDLAQTGETLAEEARLSVDPNEWDSFIEAAAEKEAGSDADIPVITAAFWLALAPARPEQRAAA